MKLGGFYLFHNNKKAFNTNYPSQDSNAASCLTVTLSIKR